MKQLLALATASFASRAYILTESIVFNLAFAEANTAGWPLTSWSWLDGSVEIWTREHISKCHDLFHSIHCILDIQCEVYFFNTPLFNSSMILSVLFAGITAASMTWTLSLFAGLLGRRWSLLSCLFFEQSSCLCNCRHGLFKQSISICLFFLPMHISIVCFSYCAFWKQYMSQAQHCKLANDICHLFLCFPSKPFQTIAMKILKQFFACSKNLLCIFQVIWTIDSKLTITLILALFSEKVSG